MPSITKPMLGRSPTPSASKGPAGSDLMTDIAYDYRRKVGAWLREHRLASGYTQEEVARYLGMGHAAISAVESGRSTISPERYEALASLLAIDPKEMGEYILRFTNPWLFKMIFPERVDKTLKADLGLLPERVRSTGPV